MRLRGKVYDFGEQGLSEHLRDIAEEMSDQAFLNGEDDADISRGYKPLYDLSNLLVQLAAEAERLEKYAGG